MKKPYCFGGETPYVVLPDRRFENCVIDVAAECNMTATFTEITNEGPGELMVRLNGLKQAVFRLPSGWTQIFTEGELPVSKLEFRCKTNQCKLQIIMA